MFVYYNMYKIARRAAVNSATSEQFNVEYVFEKYVFISHTSLTVFMNTKDVNCGPRQLVCCVYEIQNSWLPYS